MRDPSPLLTSACGQAIRKDAGKPKLSATAEYTRHCQFCRSPQPARTHHCSTCNACVMDMDHHCLFTANCVGRDNYPFFFGFILWIWILTMFVTQLSWPFCFSAIADTISFTGSLVTLCGCAITHTTTATLSQDMKILCSVQKDT